MKEYIEKIRSYWEEIKSGESKLTKNGMLIVFLSGILIYIIFLPVEEKKGQELQEEVQIITETMQEEQDYQKMIEEELEAFLRTVEGVGEVKVLVYLSTSQQLVVEREVDDETVYTANTQGEQVPFVSQTRAPGIEGIAIAVQGAEKEEVRIKVIKMVMALYGLEANKIEVLAMKADVGY